MNFNKKIISFLCSGIIGFAPVAYAEEVLLPRDEEYFDLLSDILVEPVSEPKVEIESFSLDIPKSLKGLERYVESNDIVRYASMEMGKPYVYGAVGPESFDCSGLMVHIFNKAGKKIPRTSAQQGEKGVLVRREDLQTGDLVFFDTRTAVAALKNKEDKKNSKDETDAGVFDLPIFTEVLMEETNGYRPEKVTHVGIYVGEDKFIHAADQKTGVILSSLDSKYFDSRYLFAKRY